MKNYFLETKNVLAFREAMKVLSDAKKGQPGLGVVWGQAGRGKTECAREYCVKTGAVYVRVMQDWTPRAMLAAICFEVNGSDPSRSDVAKRTIINFLESERLPLLIDEADRLRPALIEHLRDLHDMSGAPVVMVGEEALLPMIESRRRLWSRVTQCVEFGPIEQEDILLFALKAASLKLNPEAAQAVRKRSGGDFRLVWRDVQTLERLARANKLEIIGQDAVESLPSHRQARRVAR
ncbi:AAA family ATPase [Desulfonatronovibrio hydrogenovorans]|uniref:AAA family ATPase n=1 Tax=Desulfonatronovibrio hydrogenovorans TaxID=53245 RepID=UPI0005524DA3|nr:AAA family ATPase [Desulfonatronovibrio hydrogenovorans]